MDDVDDFDLKNQLTEISSTIDSIIGKVKDYEAEFHNEESGEKEDRSGHGTDQK